MLDFAQKLTELNAEQLSKRLDATEDRINEFEEFVGATLPADYRAFLSKHGGTGASAVCPIIEPNPCGDQASVDIFYGFMSDERKSNDLYFNSELLDGAPIAIPIAEDFFGNRTFLFVSGEFAGGVYFFDAQERFFWPDSQFHSMYENLHPRIQEYLDFRSSGQLSPKADGMENFYRISDSFESFLKSCRPSE